MFCEAGRSVSKELLRNFQGAPKRARRALTESRSLRALIKGKQKPNNRVVSSRRQINPRFDSRPVS
jgi:alkylated DNA nucleotide flippase Atl1